MSKKLYYTAPLLLLMLLSFGIASCGVKPGDLSPPTEQTDSNKDYPLIYPKKETLTP